VTAHKPGCARAAEEVYFYLDNEMSRFRHWRVKRHLRKCPPCTSQFDFEAEFKQVVRRKSQDAAPPELIDRLRAFLQEHGADE
jgi:mycothiol system anti-sigma-R factor